jgi:hypothetical protein
MYMVYWQNMLYKYNFITIVYMGNWSYLTNPKSWAIWRYPPGTHDLNEGEQWGR